MIKYFHELTYDEFKELVGTITYEQCMELYPAPPWCDDPIAVFGEMGCWSLVTFDETTGKSTVTGEEFCKQCDMYKE